MDSQNREIRLQAAIAAYLSGDPDYDTYRRVAACHNVNESTLRDRIKGVTKSKEEADAAR